jgi:hypothetical protein
VAASGTTTVAPLLQATRSVPIVFVVVIDPVGAGFVGSLARPGGNATGFLMFEYGLSAKWLELLKQIARGVTRVAVLRDPAIASGIGQFGAIQSAAPSLGMEASPVNVRDVGEIERDIAAFARSANGGLVVTSSPEASHHRDLIVMLAARHRLPAIYASRYFVTDGGLISYGPDILDQYRRAAGYVDRILKGEKPADLPVQAPTKYETLGVVKRSRVGDRRNSRGGGGPLGYTAAGTRRVYYHSCCRACAFRVYRCCRCVSSGADYCSERARPNKMNCVLPDWQNWSVATYAVQPERDSKPQCNGSRLTLMAELQSSLCLEIRLDHFRSSSSLHFSAGASGLTSASEFSISYRAIRILI